MGSQQSKEIKPNSGWQWVETDNGIQIYRNKQDGRIAQRRRVIVSSTYALAEQNKIYAFRSTNPHGWVKSYEVVKIQDASKQKEKISDLCRCGNQRIQLDLYTQRIQYRLSQLPQLAFPESLLILKQATVAFEALYLRVGGLHINPQLIGITEKGEVRVWVNQNWALNRPSHKIPILKSSSSKEYFTNMMPELKDQQQMVSNLVSVVSQKTENGHFPQQFANQLRNRSNNFRSLKRFLNEYVSANNIPIPTIIQKNKLNANNSTRSLDNRYTNSTSYIKPGPITVLPPQSGQQQNVQIPKFSFNNTLPHPINNNSSISFKQQPTYKAFQFKPFPTFSSLYNPSTAPSILHGNHQISHPQNLQTRQVSNTFKPYLFQTKHQVQPIKPILSGLKFNLLDKYEHQVKPIEAKLQPMSSSAVSKPESPHNTLIQFAENEGQTTHNASYKILQGAYDEIRT